MWQYNYSDDLQHYGIPGMRWGHRKTRSSGNIKVDEMHQKKAAYKQAKKEYNRAFNDAYNRSNDAYSFSKKRRQANEDRWNAARDKANLLKKAKSDYKTAKVNVKNDAQARAIVNKHRAKKAAMFTAGVGVAAAGAVAAKAIMDRKNGVLHLGNGTTLYMYPNKR